MGNLIRWCPLPKLIPMKSRKYRQINFYTEQDPPIMQIRRNLGSIMDEIVCDLTERLAVYSRVEEYS